MDEGQQLPPPRRTGVAAVIRDGLDGPEILMVEHRRGERRWWSLPGGMAEQGESWRDCAVRELAEEACLAGVAVRRLYRLETDFRITECWLMEADGEPALGGDPELGPDDQELCGIGWHRMEDVRGDQQVSQVLVALRDRRILDAGIIP